MDKGSQGNIQSLLSIHPKYDYMGTMEEKKKFEARGKIMFVHKLIFNVKRNVCLLLKVRSPRRTFLSSCPDILKELQGRNPKIKITKIMLSFPQAGWVIYNTNGESRGNLGVSSYAFCVRNKDGI